MGIYYNPPMSLEAEGRRLNSGNFEQLKVQLEEGEHLYGLYDRGIFREGYFALKAEFAPPGSQ